MPLPWSPLPNLILMSGVVHAGWLNESPQVGTSVKVNGVTDAHLARAEPTAAFCWLIVTSPVQLSNP